MKKRVMLIGLDGATFTLLDPLMDAGVMPFLKEFAQTGARAGLHSVVPPLTPPAWTSMVTGRSPGVHGVFDFFIKEASHSPYIRLASSQDVQAWTLWSMADHHGLRTTALNFPLMFPPPNIQGYVVPGWMPWRQLRLGCHPAGLYDQLRAIPGFNARELAMDMALEEKTLEGCRREEYADWIALHVRREQQWLEVLRFLVRSEPCELIAVLFDGVDKIQHLCWRFLDPDLSPAALAPWEQTVRELCLDYFRRLDQVLAEAVTPGGSGATVLIVSDHGFGPTEEVFYVNAWLHQQGYLAWAKDEGRKTDDERSVFRLGVGQQARHVFQLDWEKTLAYVPTPTSNGIHIVVADGAGRPGVPAAGYPAFRETLIQKLYQLTSPVTGEPLIARVWRREEIFAGPYQALAPDLTLSLRDGGLVSILPSDVPVRRREEVTGAHRPEGVFLARGPGIRSGCTLPSLSILDVAPTVLYCLGLPIPADLEGQAALTLFEPAQAQARPAQRETLSSPTGPSSGQFVYDAETEAAILARLRALGYVD